MEADNKLSQAKDISRILFRKIFMFVESQYSCDNAVMLTAEMLSL